LKKNNHVKISPVWLGYQLQDSSGAAIYKPSINGFFEFGAEVWVDGARIEGKHSVDIFSLLRSVHEPLKRYQSNIFTCGCGVAGCAGIIDGVVVTHQGRFVFWNFRTPLNGGWGRHSEADWVRDSKPMRLRFLRSQLIRECKSLLAFAKNASGNRLEACTFFPESAPASEMLAGIKQNWVSA
jgi:hypothetical protein